MKTIVMVPIIKVIRRSFKKVFTTDLNEKAIFSGSLFLNNLLFGSYKASLGLIAASVIVLRRAITMIRILGMRKATRKFHHHDPRI